MFCRYCKEQGHLLENCQLRIVSNNRRKENNQGNYASPSGCATGGRADFTPVNIPRNQTGHQIIDIRPVTVNLDKHSRVPTVQAHINEIPSLITFLLDTGSDPNIIKENFVPKTTSINYTSILRLNDIKNYPVYILGEVTLNLFEAPISFHIVSHDFPIPQSGILGNDFFKQTSSRIDYAQGHLTISGINIPFFSPESISPRSECLFYVRIENPDTHTHTRKGRIHTKVRNKTRNLRGRYYCRKCLRKHIYTL